MDNHQILDQDFQGDGKQASLNRETIQLINTTKIYLNAQIRDVRNARVALFIMAGLAMLSVVINSVSFGYDTYALVESVVIAIIYFACAIGTPHNPKVALITAISIFLLVWLLSVLVDISFLLHGIILKAVVLYYLGKGASGAFGLNKNLDKLYRLGLSMDQIEAAKSLQPLAPSPLPPE